MYQKRRGKWEKSPTKQYASGGPQRLGSSHKKTQGPSKLAGPNKHSSKPLTASFECKCGARAGVLKRIDGFPLESDERYCTRCCGRTVAR